MIAPAGSVVDRHHARQVWEDRLAGPMFFLALLFLIVLAGVFHRYPKLDPADLESHVIVCGLVTLWLLFLIEAVVRYRLRDRSEPASRALASALVYGLIPPLRLGCRSQTRPNHVWLPWLGWQPIDNRLRRRLERVFSVPMIIFALMVLPMLALEFYHADMIRSEPILALWVDIGTSVIWLAFAVEFTLMAEVAEHPWRYCLVHWIDAAIVLLPAIEILPLMRLLRVGRVLRLDQLLRWGRLHRLKALVARGWRALFLLQIVQRLTGRSLDKQRRQLLELVQAKEEELTDLRREIAEVEARMAQSAAPRMAPRALLVVHGPPRADHGK